MLLFTASSLLKIISSRRFSAHHANLLLRTNPNLHCTSLQCIHGTCLNFGLLLNKGNDELCICKYGFHGDHCEFQASTDIKTTAIFGSPENFSSLLWSITIMFVMISIIFLAGGYFIGKVSADKGNKNMENSLRVPKISRPVSKAPSTQNLNLVSHLGVSQSKLSVGIRNMGSTNSVHRRSMSEGAGNILGENENFLNRNQHSLKVPEIN